LKAETWQVAVAALTSTRLACHRPAASRSVGVPRRWATLPINDQPKSCLLEWVVETQGYTVTELDTVGASDSELEERVADFLAERPYSSTTTVETEVKGTASRIRKVLEGPRFDSVAGKRGAKNWFLTSTPSASANDG
jgi:hypothetical protein